jgi:hypothetical protein
MNDPAFQLRLILEVVASTVFLFFNNLRAFNTRGNSNSPVSTILRAKRRHGRRVCLPGKVLIST